MTEMYFTLMIPMKNMNNSIVWIKFILSKNMNQKKALVKATKTNTNQEFRDTNNTLLTTI